MGCFQSRHSNPQLHNPNGNFSSSSDADYGVSALVDLPAFSQFSLYDLEAATNCFSSNQLISESGEKAHSVVYEGCLENDSRRRIAIKRFSKLAWPDPKKFAAEAWRVGKLRHRRLANLIGYCCEGDERLLVAEYMPNETLAKHLFHREDHTIEWNTRSRVALSIAEALDYCSNKGYQFYNDLNAYRVLFDQNGDPRLSCFGLIKNSRDMNSYRTNAAHIIPEYPRKGRLTVESDIFSFGTVLLNLLSGEHIPPNHALDMIREKNIQLLMDSKLGGNFSIEEATVVVDLASQCLQYKPQEQPKTKYLVTTLSTLQTKPDVPSYLMLGIPKHRGAPPLSPMAEACSRMDLSAIYLILMMKHYRDDEENEAFNIQDLLEFKKAGDLAFRDRDFKTSIEYYTQFIDVGIMDSRTIIARRCLCYLFCDQPDAALRDAMQAQVLSPDWSTAFYLRAVALSKLNMTIDASVMLSDAVALEVKSKRI